MNVTAKLENGTLHYYQDGVELTPAQAKAIVATDSSVIAETNKRSLEDKATQAIELNNTYLARTSPTAAQTTAQVKLLTRENNAIIRLLLKKLDSVSGT